MVFLVTTMAKKSLQNFPTHPMLPAYLKLLLSGAKIMDIQGLLCVC